MASKAGSPFFPFSQSENATPLARFSLTSHAEALRGTRAESRYLVVSIKVSNGKRQINHVIAWGTLCAGCMSGFNKALEHGVMVI